MTFEKRAIDNQQQQGISQRRSRWLSSWAALKYINSLYKTDEVKVRESDKTTNLLLSLAILGIAVLIFCPIALARGPLALVCDLLFAATVISYIANRLGILSTLSPRQAVLVWEVCIGMAIFAVLIAVNMSCLTDMFRAVVMTSSVSK